MKAIRFALILAAAASGVACGGDGSERPGISGEPVQLEFLDSRIFDEELSSFMSEDTREITVNMPVGFHLNDIPERLDPWFYEIKQNGGKVVARPENPSRGIVSAVIDVVVAVFEMVDEATLYGPSEDYDATLLYREDGTVKRIVFERR